MTFAKVNLNVLDKTITQEAQPVGVCALAVQTQRGVIGEAVYCRSFQEFRENFGEIIDPTDTLGPIYAKRVFDNGGQAYITRIVHFTDINDIATVTATKATGDNSGTFNFSENVLAAQAGAPPYTITIAGDFTSYITAGDAHIVQLAGGGTLPLTVDVAGAVYQGGVTEITYTTAPTGVASGDTLTWSVILTNTLTYEAKNVGSWGNSVQVEIKTAASGLANAVDIFVSTTDSAIVSSEFNEVYPNFPTTPTAGDIQKFNDSMKLLTLLVAVAPIGVVPPNSLTGGTDDFASVIELDYIGSTFAGNGIRAFDDESGFVRIACPEIASNVVDNALVDYVNERKDCVAILRTPESIDARAAIDYRNAAGAYSAGVKINDWRATMLYGGLKIDSPYPPDGGAEISISWIGDFLGLSSLKDRNYGAWFSVSGFERGILTNVRDIVYNIDTVARVQERNDLTAAGLLPVVKKKRSGTSVIVSWGDRTLQVETSQLQFVNVVDLIIYISNNIVVFSEDELFEPNDVLTWKTIYRRTNTFMLDVLNRRGVFNYRYEGDQNVDNVNEATINTPSTISAGIYKFNLFIEAIPNLREVEINLIASEVGTIVDGAV